MTDVKVLIRDRDRKVGAMVKALAVEVAGYPAVKGAVMGFLQENGYYVFHFPSKRSADKFRDAVSTYLPEKFAVAVANPDSN